MKIHNTKKGVIADINMIPLIDVALILLIIFMVITPFLVQNQIKVNLPKANTGSTEGSDEMPLKITIDKNYNVYVNSKKVYNLEKELILRLSKSNKKVVLIEADKTVPIEKVVKALDSAKKLGAGKIGISVQPEN
jgi:biopolymer transport protein ExbD